jgi:aspartate kinase
MEKNKLFIEKIGGTSMSQFDKVLCNIILRDPNHIYNRVYIVSAYSGITDALLEHKKTGNPGIYKIFEQNGDYRSSLFELQNTFLKINKKLIDIGLDQNSADTFICNRVQLSIDILKSLATILSCGYVTRSEILLAAREVLASIGEVHSAYNSSDILKNKGYAANFVDLSGIEDNRNLTIDERIKSTFSSINTMNSISFVTGYTKGTEGIMREFDRGYSEVTFSKVASFLGAQEAIIHKEYHLSTGDPKIIGVDNVKPISDTNFDVTDQLADVRMEAIHPKASKILENSGIPLRIKNSFEPNHTGTLITKNYICPDVRIEMVTGISDVVYLEIHDPSMVGATGFDLLIMQILSEFRVSYICKMTNANTIGMIIYQEFFSQELMDELKKQFELVTLSDEIALVCVVGSNIDKPGILSKAAVALAKDNINIVGVSQTARQTNIQFVVLKSEFNLAQQVLHRTFCQ